MPVKKVIRGSWRRHLSAQLSPVIISDPFVFAQAKRASWMRICGKSAPQSSPFFMVHTGTRGHSWFRVYRQTLSPRLSSLQTSSCFLSSEITWRFSNKKWTFPNCVFSVEVRPVDLLWERQRLRSRYSYTVSSRRMAAAFQALRNYKVLV